MVPPVALAALSHRVSIIPVLLQGAGFGEDAPNLSDSFGVFIGAVTARDDRFEAAPSRWELQQGTTPSALLGELAAAMERRNKDHARDITTRREVSNRARERKICGDLTEDVLLLTQAERKALQALGESS